MSLCLETSSVLAPSTQVSTTTSSTESSTTVTTCGDLPTIRATTIQKLPSTTQIAPKAQLITVLNAPLGNVAKLCVTPAGAGTSNASGQFTVLNSSNNVTNATAKPQTITLINTPVTVVKTISPPTSVAEKSVTINNSVITSAAANNSDIFLSSSSTASTINTVIASSSPSNENRGHNVFVKHSAGPNENIIPIESDGIPQSHKLLTATNFPTNNLLATTINLSDAQKSVNGQQLQQQQRNKVKMLNNVLVPGTSNQQQGNVLMNKTNAQRFVPRQKIPSVGTTPNNGGLKYLNKTTIGSNHIIKNSSATIANSKQAAGGSNQRIFYPTHKSQIKTITAMNNFSGIGVGNNKMIVGGGTSGGIKTLPPSHKGIHRTGGLRTLPPQRLPSKLPPNKPNYIGKHAIQAQKLKTHKMKNLKSPNQMYNYHNHQQQIEKQQMTFNQALTAEILETLGNKTTSYATASKSYDILQPRYESNYYQNDDAKDQKSGLDTLSLICQAVLLDHNYNATLPPDPPIRNQLASSPQTQLNGSTIYSPPLQPIQVPVKRRTLSSSSQYLPSVSNTIISTPPTTAIIKSQIDDEDDDASSDISNDSDRKQDTEGEETDTAPEAEAVNNDDPFGDYVTRCICGFIHDDGYMIECDRCKVWQHVQCVVKNRKVPDEYLCEMCDPHKQIDRHKARLAQQQWLRERQLIQDGKLVKKDLKEMSGSKLKESDSDSSDGEQKTNNNNGINATIPQTKNRLVNRRKSEPKQRQRRDSGKEQQVKKQVKKRERKITKRKPKIIKNHNNSDDENVQENNGMIQTNCNNNLNHLPQLRQWIENYEEAVTNHYSPELRARISNIRVNGTYEQNTQIEYDSSVHKCRVHTQPMTELKYLVSTVQLEPNSPIIELRGKYMLSTQHRNLNNLTTTTTTRNQNQRPGPFLFFYRLHKDNTEVCVDTRTYGNSARFIRRSCRPNAELRHSIIKGVLHLYIVTIASVEKNDELTIKHESHDLAAIGTTRISCACGGGDDCTVNRTAIKKNGENEVVVKKRRGRRTNSQLNNTSNEIEVTPPVIPSVKNAKKETVIKSKEVLPPPVIVDEQKSAVIKEEVKEEAINEEIKNEESIDTIDGGSKMEVVKDEKAVVKEEKLEEKPLPSPTPPVVATPATSTIQTRRLSSRTSEREETKDVLHSPTTNDSTGTDNQPSTTSNKNKQKMTREERKLQAIIRAIDQMERAQNRKQEHHTKQHRRESEPGLSASETKSEPKLRRKRRKGRARTSSTNTNITRRNRLNSTDSYLTSGDEILLSPNIDSSTIQTNNESSDKDVGLLLGLSGGGDKVDSNSNSAQSSPETQLSSACLLVQAAVEPMEQGFKFPKTKKGLMNEWLNKTPEIGQDCDFSSSCSSTPTKSLTALVHAASFCGNDTTTTTTTTTRGSAKKRWLRQAISEDHQCDSRPESPPAISETSAPPKKRRLPRESLDITPPTTPTSLVPPVNIETEGQQSEGCVEIIYNSGNLNDDDDTTPSPTNQIESDAILEERVAEMKEEFLLSTSTSTTPIKIEESPTIASSHTLLDPRLSRLFTSELVGTVEKTLSIFGIETGETSHHHHHHHHHHHRRKPEAITPAKRKLSISEYRQRKKLNNNDKMDDDIDQCSELGGNVPHEENTSESFVSTKRERTHSTSSDTSITSSDEDLLEQHTPTIAVVHEGKVLSAFNSEPTELERQREFTTLRLKKQFGLQIAESNESTFGVETILNLDIEPQPQIKQMPPSPTFPIPGCNELLKIDSPIIDEKKDEIIQVPFNKKDDFIEKKDEEYAKNLNRYFKSDGDDSKTKILKDCCTFDKKLDDIAVDNEMAAEEEEAEGSEEETEDKKKIAKVVDDEMETVDYVPPFNNPIYPTDIEFAYSSVIDEEGRYEGRNPSPPPDLGQS